MSVKFNAVEKGQLEIVGCGSRKFYTAAKMIGEVDINELDQVH